MKHRRKRKKETADKVNHSLLDNDDKFAEIFLEEELDFDEMSNDMNTNELEED